MDILSHGLWGGVALGKKSKKNYFLSFGISLLPDFLSEGIMFLLISIGAAGMPSFEHGHPNISEFPVYAQNFYNATHSLLIFSAIFVFIWLVRKKPPILLLAWGIHIAIDIPTHSLELFPTPFLWPISEYRFNGVAWREPLVYITDIVLLLLIYSYWFFKQRKIQSKRERATV